MPHLDHFEKLADCQRKGDIPPELAAVLYNFYISYGEAVQENGYSPDSMSERLNLFADLVIDELKNPFTFEPFHQSIRHPFDYYRFGLNLIRPLVIFSKSEAKGLDHVDEMAEALAKGENIILFGNHQTEPDPQAISLLLENTHPRFAEEIIFVAGHRVISDPLAIPFSKGRNLLCIFSKRHIETPPELKEEKLLHNQRTMKRMAQLLNEGGKCIYVAPSGGRDRVNAQGIVEIAPFDPQSIEMFGLMAKKSEKPTHFYPLALSTYNLLPPPNSIEKELGERRQAHSTAIHLAFGSKIDMENYPGCDSLDKKQRRQMRAEYIWKLVAGDYEKLQRG